MQQPLTARQLITILLVLGVIAILILGVRDVNRQTSAVDRLAQCAANAPLGWDCDRSTNYPR